MNTAVLPATRNPGPGAHLPAVARRAKRPATVERILAAAERIFAERGMAGARTEEIARTARVNKALLYYYFHSKRKLHLAALDALFQQLMLAVEAALSGDSLPHQRLLAYMDAYFDFMLRHPNYPRLVQRELMEGGKNLAWIGRQYMGPIQLKVSRILKDGMACGEFRRVDATQTVLTINAMIVSYFAIAPVLSQVLGRDALAKEAVAARREAILDFLEHGLLRNPKRSSEKRKP
jgi:TetR/AcrR family transcriptional regulator